ncbi:hypothetical protein JCM10908_007170 [Rhodotorula pacifica]|uniref:uncharacterized protein n=1 Tax=Rhodotorula pacifica TaxID=1495444 RepID=UPI00316EFD6E
MLVPLTLVDGAVANMDICCGFVYSLPNGKDPKVAQAMLDSLEAATKRVVTKWRLLQGHPIYNQEKRIWFIEVPDDVEKPNLSRPYLFTSDRVNSPYHRAVGESAPLTPLSSTTTPCGEQPKHTLEYFRHPKLPSTFDGCSKEGASIFAVRAVVFDDAITVGITVPHGAFDATGMGWTILALRAELHYEPNWGKVDEATALWDVNPVASLISELQNAPDSASKEAADIALPAWVSAGKLSHAAKFLLNYVVEKKVHHDEPRHFFLSKRAIDALIESVKKEVAIKTDGKEWVSTGDVLNAWTLKNFHAHEAKSGTSAIATPVFSLRDLLGVSGYVHNAVGPYSFAFRPLPLSEIARLSLADLALIHRRTLAECRSKPYLTATLKKMDRLTESGKVPLMPERAWPWKLMLSRLSNNGKKGKPGPLHHTVVSNQCVADVADLTLPGPPAPAVSEKEALSSDADSDRTAEGATTPTSLDAEKKEKKLLLTSPAHPAIGADLPLLAYYMRITAPIKDHQSYRFQQNEKGIFMEGCMRRKRWANITKAVEDLEREFGSGVAAK